MDIRNHWEKNLKKLSELLIPSKEDLSSGVAVANQVFHTLKGKSKYEIDRMGVFGSIQKETVLKMDVDFDCVIFVNDVCPPFDKVFEDFASVLEVRENLDVDAIYPRKWKNSLQAKINGKEFDICPATNFSKDPEKQRNMTMKRIRELPHPGKDGYKYSSGLAESQVQFIKLQSAFTHDLIRLAKYWNKTIFIEEYISGRSSLIELMAVYAAHEEANFSDMSLLRSFRRFLTLVSNFDTLDIVFEMFYTRQQVDSYIAKQKPLVLDPCNPYNNFAHSLGKKEMLINKMKQFAQTTIQRLENGFATLSINDIFVPQPKVAPNELLKRCIPTDNWLVGVREENANHPNMVVRNEKKVNNVGLKIIQHYLGNNIEFLNNNSNSETTIKKRVSEIVDINIAGMHSPRKWTPSEISNHADFDATFEVPCGKKLVRASVKW